MIERIGEGWGHQWTPPVVSHAVGVVSDDDAIVANLSVSELFTQREAQIPGTILISGSVLPGSSGADHIVAGHESFRLIDLSMAADGGQWGDWWTVCQPSPCG
jgi:hypothetical protein